MTKEQEISYDIVLQVRSNPDDIRKLRLFIELQLANYKVRLLEDQLEEVNRRQDV